MSSIHLDAKTKNQDIISADCFDVAEATEEAFLDEMVQKRMIPSAQISFEVFAAAFDACEATQD